MVPRTVASMSEYVAYSGWPSRPNPVSGVAQSRSSLVAPPAMTGTGTPAGNSSHPPAWTVCAPGASASGPSAGCPSTVPWADTDTVAGTRSRTEVSIRMLVRAAKTGDGWSVTDGAPPWDHANPMKTSGTVIAVILTQYWNACT